MSSWNRIQRVCATCRYWCGSRDIDVWGGSYTAEEDYGKCANTQGGFRNTSMHEGASCVDWEAFND